MERIVTDEETVDVAVVGAGVVGAALAREFAGRGASVALVEARSDVGDATSKRSSHFKGVEGGDSRSSFCKSAASPFAST